MKRQATRTHQKPGVGNYEKTSNTDPPKTRGGQLSKDEQHGPTKNQGWATIKRRATRTRVGNMKRPTKNQGWATMKRRATRTHQKPGVGNWATMGKRRATRTHQKQRVGNYEKTSNTDPPKTRGGQL